MQVGFTVVRRDQDVEFQLFGPRGHGGLLQFFQTADQAAVLLGRLHYRRELCAKLASALPGPLLQECQANDAALALAAYRHRGLQGIEHLEGDFALVIQDTRADRLIGSRDPMGGYPLFWVQGDGVSTFGTNLYSLLNRLPRRSLDQEYLADYLMMPWPVDERRTEQCAFQGVQRVLPGTVVCADLATGRVARHVYWDWLERMTDPGTDSVEEISARYGDLLRGAVRERLHGRTACHFSGGMDSTAVSLLARDWIASGACAGPLHALSLVYERLPGLARERPYLEAALREQPGLVAHRIPADDLLDYSSFAAAPPHDEPYVGLWRFQMQQATLETAAELGAETVLTGIGGDDLVEISPPFHLGDLLRRGRLLAAWAEACRWARVANCSPWKLLYEYGMVNCCPAWTCGGVEPWLRRGYARWNKQNEWTIAPWIVPDFARRQALRGRAVENARRMYPFGRPMRLSQLLNVLAMRTGEVQRSALAAPRGIALAHPFLDPRLICFGLGMQARLPSQPHGHKPVLAKAMRGALPAVLTNRREKGDFNEVLFLGLSRHLPALEAMIRQTPIEDLGVFNKETLLRCLHQAALGVVKGVHGLLRLNLALAFIKWFSMQGAWQHTAEPAAEVRHVRRPGGPQESSGAARGFIRCGNPA
jgi:asparagine synthase (glutamine-hydrolysing)